MTTPQKGYYSVIQYCPDLGRWEAANIGVLLFCPDTNFLRAITTKHNRRIIRFFGSKGQDWKQVNTIKKSLEKALSCNSFHINSLDDLRHFIATRANALQFTPPRPIKVTDPQTVLRDLYDRVVGDSQESSSGRGRPNVRDLLDRSLAEADVRRKLFEDIHIELPSLGREVSTPYGYQNGRFHAIDAVSFTGTHDQSWKTACLHAIDGRALFEHVDPKLGRLRLVIVGQFREDDPKTREDVRRVLEANQVKLFPTERISSLIEDIQATARDVSSGSVDSITLDPAHEYKHPDN